YLNETVFEGFCPTTTTISTALLPPNGGTVNLIRLSETETMVAIFLSTRTITSSFLLPNWEPMISISVPPTPTSAESDSITGSGSIYLNCKALDVSFPTFTRTMDVSDSPLTGTIASILSAEAETISAFLSSKVTATAEATPPNSDPKITMVVPGTA